MRQRQWLRAPSVRTSIKWRGSLAAQRNSDPLDGQPSIHGMRKAGSLARSGFMIALAVSLAACPRKAAIWVAPGSSTDSLVFDLGPVPGEGGSIAVSRIAVFACSDSTANRLGAVMWDASTTAGRAQALDHVHYGILPPDFKSKVEPIPLKPGCYVAEIEKSRRFTVTHSGAIIDEGSPW